jgi:hypothetical protein
VDQVWLADVLPNGRRLRDRRQPLLSTIHSITFLKQISCRAWSC